MALVSTTTGMGMDDDWFRDGCGDTELSSSSQE